MKRIVFTFLMMLSFGVSEIQSAGLTGKVVDSNGRPLQSVSVMTDVSGVGTQTAADGTFTLTYPSEVTRVTFSSIGYQARQFKIGSVPSPVVLSGQYYRGQDIVVTADRADVRKSPVPFANLSRQDIERDYQVGEFPLLLETTPNLYAYSDGGGLLGYSYMSIRGFDDKRINTYINGVPLNDPEDQATYFVDLPDFAATVTDIQVQRGVGNSLYGDASFGGSVNIATRAFTRERNVTFTSGYGQYRSGEKSVGEIAKQSIEYCSGLIDGRWQFTGRYSKQRSGGYRENSWYDGWAYYFSIARLDPHMTTELHWYGGPMQMHLAYYGATREDIALDRRVNYLTYENETDNFNQPHYQLHNIYRLSDKATLTNTLYYIRGKGYYEQLKSDRNYREYDIDTSMFPSGDSVGNLVRQQWVAKNQLGWNPSLDIDYARGRHSVGGSFYYFDSDHWGQVVWAQHISGSLDPRHRYYQYYGKKWVASWYAQESYRFSQQLNAQATAQLRYQRYKFDQDKMGAFRGFDYDIGWLFFSPRVGLNYAVGSHVSLFTNLAVSSRTPTDAEIYDAGDPKKFPSLEILGSRQLPDGDTVYTFGDPTARSERVVNLELGGNYRGAKAGAGINLFWMDFRHEIIPYGGVNPNNGLAMTVNADRSVHSGIELSGDIQAIPELKLSGNLSFNYNRVKKYDASFSYEFDSLIVNPVTHDSTHVYRNEAVTISFKDKKLTGFPEYLGSLVADFKRTWLRVTCRQQFVGRQWMELLNLKSLSIDPHATTSVSIAASCDKFLNIGRLTLSLRIDNLFNSRYEASGYGGNYVYRNMNELPTAGGWAEYFVAAERNFYTQLRIELF